MPRGIFPSCAAGTSTSLRLGRIAGLAFVLGAVAGCAGSTTTVTRTTTAATAAGPTTRTTVSASRSDAVGGSASSFAEIGTKSVGTIDVPLNSTLDWTCSGDCSSFRITNNPNDANMITVDASGSSGSIPIVAGTYHDVQVTTGGKWQFTIVPAGGP